MRNDKNDSINETLFIGILLTTHWFEYPLSKENTQQKVSLEILCLASIYIQARACSKVPGPKYPSTHKHLRHTYAPL